MKERKLVSEAQPFTYFDIPHWERTFDSLWESVVITSVSGTIEYVNEAFSKVTGYALRDVKGRNPRILKSGMHDSEFYEKMWDKLLGDKEWEGEIWNRRKNGDVYPERLRITAIQNERGDITHFVGAFNDISEYKQLMDKVHHEGLHDPLTGLRNRAAFQRYVDRLRKAFCTHGTHMILVLLDLDRFKNVNDSLGQSVGNEVLIETAKRLSAGLREQEVAARMGGDEFGVLVHCTDEKNVMNRIADIVDRLREPILVGPHEVFVTVSAGAVVVSDATISAERLLDRADAAMYRAREHGGDRIELFETNLQMVMEERARLESHLRKALERSELSLHYQPQIDIMTGKVIGAEALLRWNSAALGTISPSKFIPVAEETGLIIPIGAWVLREACKQHVEWDKNGFGKVHIAVNLSARQFQQDDLVATVRGALHESGMEPFYLELEITESSAMTNVKRAMQTLNQLRQLGITLSIDDFGTGYSSLSYLKKLPVKTLKIDQSFVREIPYDLNSVAIVRAIITVAHSLNLEVIAEGVETMEQLAFLKQYGCDHIQGFLVSRPICPCDVETFIENWKDEESPTLSTATGQT